MKYSRILTQNHPVSLIKPECLINFNDLNVTEGFDEIVDLFADNIIVLDLDCVELKNALTENRNKRSSMDCTFAIVVEGTVDHEMLMVELRYNYISMRNLSGKKLIEKVSGSTLALGDSTTINGKSIFIFKTDLKEQAKSRLFRMLPRVPSDYIIMDLYELKAQYFS